MQKVMRIGIDESTWMAEALKIANFFLRRYFLRLFTRNRLRLLVGIRFDPPRLLSDSVLLYIKANPRAPRRVAHCCVGPILWGGSFGEI